MWRSQMAEAIYSKVSWKSSLSIAGSEDRKEKYRWVPDENITHFIKQKIGLDISKKRIKYLSDLSKRQISSIEKVIFFYNPIEDCQCDHECKKNGLSPYEYFSKKDIEIKIFPIPDPYNLAKKDYHIPYLEIENYINLYL